MFLHHYQEEWGWYNLQLSKMAVKHQAIRGSFTCIAHCCHQKAISLFLCITYNLLAISCAQPGFSKGNECWPMHFTGYFQHMQQQPLPVDCDQGCFVMGSHLGHLFPKPNLIWSSLYKSQGKALSFGNRRQSWQKVPRPQNQGYFHSFGT